MRTMKWPPKVEGGRCTMVEGVDAAVVLVEQVCSDLQTQPFNSDDLSLGDPTFKPNSGVKARIGRQLERLSRTISIESITERVDEDGNPVYDIALADRESRTKRKVTLNG